MRQSLYGTPLPVQPKSAVTVLLLEPSEGFSMAQPPTDLSPGQTPESFNFLMREGALELRPTLSSFTSNANPVGPVTGGYTLISSVNSSYPIVSGQSQLAYYSDGSWSTISYVSAGSMPDNPISSTSLQYADMVQSYEPAVDDMVAIIALGSYQTLLTWQSGAGVYSSITSAPRAKYLAVADNFVLAANVRDVGSVQSYYVQRVQWSDRGGPLSWDLATNSLAGFEDLLDAKGAITRLMVIDNLLIVFFEEEIWQGIRQYSGSAAWSFQPLDRTVGCPFPWTIAITPLGICFLGRDLMVYLLPKGGGPPAPIGAAVRRWLAGRIDNPELSWAAWDPDTNTYRLHYATAGGTGFPTEAIWLNLGENSWAPQTYVNPTGTHSLTRGFVSTTDAVIQGITWQDLLNTGEAWNSIASSWQDLFGRSSFAARTMAMGSSEGTIYYDSTGTTDDGLPVLATWRSQALDADSPGVMGVMQEIRTDYYAPVASSFTLRTSRDQGGTWDPPSLISVSATPSQGVAYFYPYTAAPYPTFEVSTSNNGLRIFRFWAKLRQGGRI